MRHQPLHHRTHRTPAKGFFGWALFLAIGTLLSLSIYSANAFGGILAWTVGLLYVSYDTWLLAYVAWKTRAITAVKSPTALAHSNVPAVSIGVLVPAHNESAVIVATLHYLLQQQQGPEQIIVINDGSTDDTSTVLQAGFQFTVTGRGMFRSASHPQLFLLEKHNSGKADSLNLAMPHLQCDVVVTVDADTLLAPGAIAEIRRAFTSEQALVAACGVLSPRTRGGLVSRCFAWFQYFEYLRAFLARAAWMQSNALLLVSGAFAAYRKSALVAIGGYDKHSLVEDYELIHRLHKYACDRGCDWTVRVLPGAQADTDAPASLRAFLQQRKRWFTGFLRTQFQYRDLIGATRYKQVGKLMLPIKTVDTLQPLFGLVAFSFLLRFLFTDIQLASQVLAVILIKLGIDFCYHLWALRRYHQWLQQPVAPQLWWRAVLCCLTEPFFFQLIRHVGALLGWSSLLTGKAKWKPIRHAGPDYFLSVNNKEQI
ncbi:glycosyltransferase [Permianibacter sp. IMCC34836]|uniref:glycosyltransferase family 2 protein n=1 Tax=Permianibacter fluminis TaxID=2738515 RepID=UPI001557E9CF|nr:glycosyltransferase family 2 protein [Permianibacter fluminis]NQD35971.1 glycosyltransferase [Permianibacter fluminis]